MASSVSRPLLQAVHLQLVDQSDAALVATHVDDDSTIFLDRVERSIQLWAALALLRGEHFTREALRVHPQERAVLRVALDDRQVVGAGLAVTIRTEAERAVLGRHVGFHLEDRPWALGMGTLMGISLSQCHSCR